MNSARSASNQMKFFRGFRELVAELGMSKTDQGIGTFCGRQSLEIDGAELGDDVVGIDARRRNGSVQARYDPRNLTRRRGGTSGNDGLAAFGGECTADKIELTAGGAVLVAEHML
jgi:hypothetical protein